MISCRICSHLLSYCALLNISHHEIWGLPVCSLVIDSWRTEVKYDHIWDLASVEREARQCLFTSSKTPGGWWTCEWQQSSSPVPFRNEEGFKNFIQQSNKTALFWFKVDIQLRHILEKGHFHFLSSKTTVFLSEINTINLEHNCN